MAFAKDIFSPTPRKLNRIAAWLVILAVVCLVSSLFAFQELANFIESSKVSQPTFNLIEILRITSGVPLIMVAAIAIVLAVLSWRKAYRRLWLID
jgi:cation transporter-like permease